MHQSTKMRVLLGALWGLAGYCAYSVAMACRTLLMHSERIPHFGITFWAPAILALVGMFFYSVVALRISKNTITHKTLCLFLLFSGLFAGVGTIPICIRLFPEFAEPVFTGSFYQWLFIRSSVSIIAMVVAVAIIRSYSDGKNWRYFIITFAITTLFIALLQIGKQYGITHIDSRLLLAGAGFAAFAYFFPNAARMMMNMAAVLFVGVFAAVGGVFNRHRG